MVLQRDDGHFTFAEEYCYVSHYEGEIIAQGWHRLPPNGIYQTADIAENEGRAAFSKWHRLLTERQLRANTGPIACPAHPA